MIDLHTHSNFSDGTYSPEELIIEAKEKGIEALALTDHDTAEGIRALKNFNFPIKFVPGIELSLQYDKELRFHIVGLFIEANSEEVLKIEKFQVECREERNLKIFEKLKELNYDISYEEVKKEAKKTVGRMHFASCLVKKGYFKKPEEAISSLLRLGKPAFVERKRLNVQEGIESIRKMKGISMVAHIGKELEDFNKIEEVLKKIKDFGIDGIEVFHSDHSNEMTKFLKKISKKYSFLISGGSDFHGFNKEKVNLGTGKGNLKIPLKVYNNLLEYWIKNKT